MSLEDSSAFLIKFRSNCFIFIESPKINMGLESINNGVTAVGIIDARPKHSILFELFSDKGSGTLIRK